MPIVEHSTSFYYMITLLLKPQYTCTICLSQVRVIFIILALYFSETHIHIDLYA